MSIQTHFGMSKNYTTFAPAFEGYVPRNRIIFITIVLISHDVDIGLSPLFIWTAMETTTPHFDSIDPKDAGIVRMIGGMGEILNGVKEQFARCAQEKQQAMMQIAYTDEKSNIVADGKQNELIAIFNVIYEAGMVTNCSKAEFIKRIADAMGAPGMAAHFSKALYNIKLTYKYDEIFTKLNEAALIEKKK